MALSRAELLRRKKEQDKNKVVRAVQPLNPAEIKAKTDAGRQVAKATITAPKSSPLTGEELLGIKDTKERVKTARGTPEAIPAPVTPQVTEDPNPVKIISDEETQLQEGIDIAIQRKDLRQEATEEGFTSLQRKIKFAEEQGQQALKRGKEQAEAQKGAVIASTSGSRQGAQASTTPMIQQQFVGRISEDLKTSRDAIFQKTLDLEDMQKDLDRARADDDLSRQEDVLIAMRETRKAKVLDELELKSKQEESRKDLSALIDKVPPEVFGAMTPEAVGQLFENAGLPLSAGLAFQSQQAALNEAQQEFLKSPTQENQNKVLALQGNIDKIKFESQKAEQTKLDSKVDTLQGLLDNGTIDQQQFDDALESELGILDKETALDKQKQQADLALTQAKTEVERVKAQEQIAYLNELGVINGVGKDISQKLADTPIGVVPTRAAGQSKEFTGQCSAFVNDTLGTPHKYGTTIASKKRNINNTDVFNPKAGSVFISTIGNEEIGHVGFVESVNADGSVWLVDSNRNDDRLTNRRKVDIKLLGSQEGIIGYEDLVQNNRNGTGKVLSLASQTDLVLAGQKKLTGKALEKAQARAIKGGYQDKFIEAMTDGSTDAGKILPADKVVMLSDAEFFPQMLTDLESTITGGEVVFSPIWGNINSINPFDVTAQTARAELKRNAQLVGKFMEGGVLRKEDEVKYAAMLPRQGDLPEVALNKLRGIRKMLKDKGELYIKNLGAAGFDVSGFEQSINSLRSEDDIGADQEQISMNTNDDTFLSGVPGMEENDYKDVEDLYKEPEDPSIQD